MPLTKKEKRQIRHIAKSEREEGIPSKHALEIAKAVVYHRKQTKERMNA